jgi:hypothetical protein
MKDPADKKTKDAFPGRPGRPRLNDVAPLSPAQRAKRYREARADMRTLNIFIEPKLHARLTRLAKRADMTLKDYVISVLEGAK